VTASLKASARRSESRRMTRPAALVALCALLLSAPLPAAAEIYRWTDEQGVERFSDRIENVPERFRTDVTAELRSDPAQRAEPAPAPPAPAEAPLAAQAPVAPDAPPAQLPDWTGRLLQLGVATVVAAALAGIGLYLVFMAFTLRLALRLVGDEVPGFGRAFAVAAAQMVAGIAVGALLGGVVLAGAFDPASPALQGAQILIGFGVNALVLQAMLGLGFGRALVVALVELVVTIVLGVALGIAIAFLVGGLAATGAG
jgi:hypothetical protein